MSTASHQDVRLEYEVQGDGDPLLLVQGLGYGRAGWGPLRDLLAKRYTVVSYDNRGFGDSDKPPGPYTTTELADDAAAVLAAAGFEHAHVVGASLGGMAAQELALRHPLQVDKLVLCCTTPGGADAFPLPERTAALFAEAASLEPLEALRRFVANSLAPDAPASLAEEVLAYRVRNPPDLDGWQAQAAAGTTHDASSRLAAIDAPTLVIHGTADNVVDHRNATLLAERIPHASLQLLEGAGHLLFWERADRVAALITEFLG
jgi:pimeloyl-ACP methyl ester carboxylesterase